MIQLIRRLLGSFGERREGVTTTRSWYRFTDHQARADNGARRSSHLFLFAGSLQGCAIRSCHTTLVVPDTADQTLANCVNQPAASTVSPLAPWSTGASSRPGQRRSGSGALASAEQPRGRSERWAEPAAANAVAPTTASNAAACVVVCQPLAPAIPTAVSEGSSGLLLPWALITDPQTRTRATVQLFHLSVIDPVEHPSMACRCFPPGRWWTCPPPSLPSPSR